MYTELCGRVRVSVEVTVVDLGESAVLQNAEAAAEDEASAESTEWDRCTVAMCRSSNLATMRRGKLLVVDCIDSLEVAADFELLKVG